LCYRMVLWKSVQRGWRVLTARLMRGVWSVTWQHFNDGWCCCMFSFCHDGLSIHQVDCHMRITITMCGMSRGLHVAFVAKGCHCWQQLLGTWNELDVLAGSELAKCVSEGSFHRRTPDRCVRKNENANPFAWLNRQDSLMGFSWEKIGTFQVYPPKPPITSS